MRHRPAADVTGKVRAAAQLQAEVAHAHRAHRIAILFAEERHRTHRTRFLQLV
jgi:hypothetical protein